LSQGERIVVSGQYRVRPGGALQILDDQDSRTAVTPITLKVE
jgi:hypothetical protein